MRKRHKRMLKALLIKKNGTTIDVYGPLSASEIRGRTDIDMVVYMCDSTELADPDNKSDIKAFEQCTTKSKLAESSIRTMRHTRTISYMLGSVLSEEIKDIYFTNVDYKG